MNREAEEFRISSDIKEANNEVLRGRLEQAEALLREAEQNTWHPGVMKGADTLAQRINKFIASQQGEQHTCKNCLGVDPESCMFKHSEQAEGAQGEREAFEAHFGPFSWDESDFEAEQAGWKARAALAQPSPAPELDAIAQEMKPLPAEFAQVIEDNLPDLLIKGEQAQELELERPEVVARVDGSDKDWFIQPEDETELHNEGLLFAGCELGRMVDFDRIVGALRAEIERFRWGLGIAQRHRDEALQELNAAQARVAELEQCLYQMQEAAKSLSAPVAQAGQVPEGYVLVPANPLEWPLAIGAVQLCKSMSVGCDDEDALHDAMVDMLAAIAAAPAQGE